MYIHDAFSEHKAVSYEDFFSEFFRVGGVKQFP